MATFKCFILKNKWRVIYFKLSMLTQFLKKKLKFYLVFFPTSMTVSPTLHSKNFQQKKKFLFVPLILQKYKNSLNMALFFVLRHQNIYYITKGGKSF